MTIFTRDQLSNVHDFEKLEVDVTEWGAIDPDTGKRQKTTLFVRELTAKERDQFEASLYTGRGHKREYNPKHVRARLAIATCCDADGKPIFLPEDLDWLSSKPVRVINRIYEAAVKLNGLSDADEEELVKN